MWALVEKETNLLQITEDGQFTLFDSLLNAERARTASNRAKEIEAVEFNVAFKKVEAE